MSKDYVMNFKSVKFINLEYIIFVNLNILPHLKHVNHDRITNIKSLIR